ncbi:MAG: hypothetical protein ACI4XJ_11380 [Eubacteriales bacterium]
MKKLPIILSALIMTGACALGVSAVDGNNVTAYGTPIAQTMAPQGGGNHDINIIVDGVIPSADAESIEQYDTYHGETDPYEEFFGLDFGADVTFTGFEFTEGKHFVDGGYFVDGTLRVQVCQNGTWTDVAATNEVGYPTGTTQADFGDNCETYTFEFEPVTGTAIRVIGTAGGSDTVRFASCGEIAAYSTTDMSSFTTYADRLAAAAEEAAKAANEEALKRAAEGFIEQISTPITTYSLDEIKAVSGGSKDLATINDGYIPTGDDPSSLQFDTVNNVGKWDPYHEEYIGYEFPATYTVEYVLFVEGGNFVDGGFFGDGDIRLEALIDGEWTEVKASISPEYKVGETQEEMLPNYEQYTFTLDTPTSCDGIRVIGTAGGSAYFISCGELIVKAETTEAPAEENVPEEMVSEETVEAPAEENVPEEMVSEETVEAPAEKVEESTVADTAPQTSDAAVITAIIAAVSSLAAYSFKKRK